MARYNTFYATSSCPNRHTTRVAFQGDAGWLDWEDFELQDSLLDRSPKHRSAKFAPHPSARELHAFWVAGLGSCPACGADIYARLRFRGGRFVGADVVPPPVEPGFLYDWAEDD